MQKLVHSPFKVARPGFSLTIPTLLEQEIDLYLFVGYRLNFKKVGFFFEIDEGIATR